MILPSLKPADISLDLLIALGSLEPDIREAWVDHHIVGRSYREIGETLGVSGTTAARMERLASDALAWRFIYDDEISFAA